MCQHSAPSGLWNQRVGTRERERDDVERVRIHTTWLRRPLEVEIHVTSDISSFTLCYGMASFVWKVERREMVSKRPYSSMDVHKTPDGMYIL